MSTASELERQMLALINAERAQAGLPPVRLELNLNEAAEDHSQWMLNTDTFSHTGQGGSSASQRMDAAGFDFSGSWRATENIAWQSIRGAPGLSDDVENLHNSLMNSPGHRANILDPNVTVVGIGIEVGKFEGWDAIIVTQNFARTSGQLDLDNGNSGDSGDSGGSGNNAAQAPAQPVQQEAEAPSQQELETSAPVRKEVWAGTHGTAQDDWLVMKVGSAGLLDGHSGHDTLVGQRGADTLIGRYGFDKLIGNDGADKIYAGFGNDEAFGGNHNDLIYGGEGDDRLFGGNGEDKLFGGDGADFLFGGDGWDDVQGGDGNDRVFGGNGNDRVIGKAGDDTLGGGNGNDWLFGGFGDNVLTGGTGADDFVFGYGNQLVTDFAASEGDQVHLKFVKSSITSYQDLMENHISQRGRDVVIEDDSGFEMRLENTLVADLGHENFLF